MSSILEALKKAERESASEHAADTPWPAPLSEPQSYRPRPPRRWMILGFVGVVCIGILAFWMFQRTPEPETLARVPVPRQEPSATTNKPPLVADRQTPTPKSAPANPSRPPAQQPKAATPHRIPPVAKASPSATTPSEGPTGQKRFPLMNPSANASSIQKSPSLQPDRQLDRATDQAAGIPVKKATSSPKPIAETSDRSTPVEEKNKNFRSDPRIELQALVWAPEATSRFVVINNRLVKEGGSFDNIVVMEINRDDVLLSEGADRWYEEFKIR